MDPRISGISGYRDIGDLRISGDLGIWIPGSSGIRGPKWITKDGSQESGDGLSGPSPGNRE